MEEMEEKLKVLEALSTLTEPSGASDVSEITGQDPFQCRHFLYELGRSGLVEKPDKKKKLYIINENGMQFLENPAEESPKVPPREPPKGTRKEPLKEPLKESPKDPSLEEAPEGTAETVLSQSDLFRGIGERLSIAVDRGEGKGGRGRERERNPKQKKSPRPLLASLRLKPVGEVRPQVKARQSPSRCNSLLHPEEAQTKWQIGGFCRGLRGRKNERKRKEITRPAFWWSYYKWGYRLRGIADVTTIGTFVRDIAHSDRPLCV